MNIYEKEKLLMDIKAEIPRFDEEDLAEYTKIVLPNVHIFLCQEKIDKIKKYCTQKLIKKMQENQQDYRISKNIDNVRVENAKLEGYTNSDNKISIKINASIFFYDDVDNNINNEEAYDKYWNDIWIVTYELNDTIDITNKCPSCGAPMEYNKFKHMFSCNYCRNSLYYSQINWKIVDIEVK